MVAAGGNPCKLLRDGKRDNYNYFSFLLIARELSYNIVHGTDGRAA